MRRLLKLIDAISIGTGKAVAVTSLATALIITYEIIVRDFFHSPTTWVAEGTVFLCGILYLVGGAWTLLEDKHVRVDMLYNRLGPRARAAVDACTYLGFVLYISVMIWATANYAFESLALRETTMTPWNPPIWPMKLIMLVSLAMVFLQGTAKFIRDIYFLIKGENI